MRYLAFFFTVTLSATTLFASSAGQTGRTSATSAGCGGGGCHGGSTSSATSIRVPQAVDGVITVAPGSQTTITVIVAHSSRPAAGINIGVKTTATGTTAAGTLATVAGEGLRVSVGELTHSTPKTLTSGEVSFTFSWTAPTQPGTYFLRAISNAVNRDGSSGTGDQWNWMTPVQIVVSPTNSVDEYSSVDVVVSPVPAHESVSMTVPTAPGEHLRIAVIDQRGSTVATDEQTATGESFRYVWNGRLADGSPAPQGPYVVTIMSQRRLMKGRAIIIR
ncbi:MAG: hypothetical protein NTX15_07680 [Candidatus Kapabacteria bacterium]|nr:hypothetical protein [Candidatus Kapabacteria bacterium]